MKVAIVGAGPAGLLLAQHLATRSASNVPEQEIIVLDRQPSPAERRKKGDVYSYPITLQDRGMRALRGISPTGFIEQRLAPRSRWIRQISLHQGPFEQMLQRADESLVMEHMTLTEELVSLIQDTSASNQGSSVSFCWETSVDAICWHNHTIVTTETGTAEKSYLPFDVLVAADGMHSVVRETLNNYDKTDFESQETVVPGGFIPFQLSSMGKSSKPLTPNAIHGWMSGKKNILAAFLPNKRNVGTAVFSYTTTENPLREATTVKDVYRILGNDLSSYVSSKEAMGLMQHKPADFVVSECNRLVDLSVNTVFLGDAAHTFSSAINQGCNAALEDAHILQQCLRDCGNAWQPALVLYQAKRGPEIEAAQILSKYSVPTQSVSLQMEMIGRMILRKVLPSSWALTEKLFPPMPMELLPRPGLSYTDIMNQTSWWTDKVEKSLNRQAPKHATSEQPSVLNMTENSGDVKHRIFRFTQ